MALNSFGNEPDQYEQFVSKEKFDSLEKKSGSLEMKFDTLERRYNVLEENYRLLEREVINMGERNNRFGVCFEQQQLSYDSLDTGLTVLCVFFAIYALTRT